MNRRPFPLLSPVRLRPLVRHYAWGDETFLPTLLGATPDRRPWAEAWFGAHPTGSAFVTEEHCLREAIACDPAAMLGEDVARRFGQLPYLLKIIAPRQPLSIQVHPGALDAAAGFARENDRGLALDNPTRCYRDPNPKPELLYAITPFLALCGFRSRSGLRDVMALVPEWIDVLGWTPELPLEALLDRLMACPETTVTETWNRTIARLRPEVGAPSQDPRHWLVRAFDAHGPDRSLLFLVLLAPRQLQPGECLYVHPGTVHAYLHGAAVEVMANSDNIVRAGLTQKHVDLAEFLRVAHLAPAPALAPVGSGPESPGEAVMPTPTDAFRLTRLDLGATSTLHTAQGPETWLVLPDSGPVTLRTAAEALELQPGQAAFVPHGVAFGLTASRQRAQVVRAAVPRPRDPWTTAGHILHNLATTDALVEHGRPAAVVSFVSGHRSSVRTWTDRLERARDRFGAREGVALHEDRPVNQALGVLLCWQRLRDRVRPGEGVLAAFVFGEGTRATPLTEAEGGDKPAIRTFVRDATSPDGFATTAEVALRTFLPIEHYLRRSGFDGLVVKWGDEIQIPSIDLSTTDPQLRGADVVRFVSMQPMTEHTAAHKDWIGTDAHGAVTGFVARRPLADMHAMVGRGVVRKDGVLWGGINLGSIAMSRSLLDALCAEFGSEIADMAANRRERPDLDPQFFTALTVARIADASVRHDTWATLQAEVPALRALSGRWSNLVERLHTVVDRLVATRGRPLSIRALDLGEPFWGDIGQHRQMFDWVHGLRDPGPRGVVTRALAGLPAEPDSAGNWIADDCVLGADVRVRNSVLLGVSLDGGCVDGSVLVGTTVSEIDARDAFDHGTVAPALTLHPRAGSYRVTSPGPVVVGMGERLTTVFLDEGPVHLRVDEATPLRDRAATYDVPILDNPIAFAEAHRRAAEVGPDVRRQMRQRLQERLLRAPSARRGN